MSAFVEFQPYDDQVEAINNIRQAFTQYRRVLFRGPTGFGKTFVFTYIARRLAQKNIRLGIVVHRQELVQDRKSTRLNSSHVKRSRMPSSA